MRDAGLRTASIQAYTVETMATTGLPEPMGAGPWWGSYWGGAAGGRSGPETGEHCDAQDFSRTMRWSALVRGLRMWRGVGDP